MLRLRYSLARTVRAADLVLLRLLAALVSARQMLSRRLRRLDDTGSETVEKAVLTAIGLGIAVGLAAAIKAAVDKYQGQIR